MRRHDQLTGDIIGIVRSRPGNGCQREQSGARQVEWLFEMELERTLRQAATSLFVHIENALFQPEYRLVKSNKQPARPASGYSESGRAAMESDTAAPAESIPKESRAEWTVEMEEYRESSRWLEAAVPGSRQSRAEDTSAQAGLVARRMAPGRKQTGSG